MRLVLAAGLAAGLAVLTAGAVQAETRVALVIGNAQYTAVPTLPNPANDASLIAKSLKQIGFTVTLKKNVNKAALEQSLQDFSQSVENSDVALIYYAGHGVEVGGTNYLVPIDAKLAKERDVDFEAVSLPSVLRTLEGAHQLRMVVLDACRNNPFKMQPSGSSVRAIGQRGLARVEPAGDTLVAYAAKEGTTASDGQDNSPFAKALASELAAPGLDVRLMFGRVRDDVLSATGKAQEPYLYGSLGGSAFYLVPPSETKAVAPAAVETPTAKASASPTKPPAAPIRTNANEDLAYWKTVVDSGDAELLQGYVDKYPRGQFVGQARQMIEQLSAGQSVSATLDMSAFDGAQNVAPSAETAPSSAGLTLLLGKQGKKADRPPPHARPEPPAAPPPQWADGLPPPDAGHADAPRDQPTVGTPPQQQGGAHAAAPGPQSDRKGAPVKKKAKKDK